MTMRYDALTLRAPLPANTVYPGGYNLQTGTPAANLFATHAIVFPTAGTNNFWGSSANRLASYNANTVWGGRGLIF